MNNVWGMTLVLGIVLTLSAEATVYNDMENSFQKSVAPQVSLLAGYWSGRCADIGKPDTLLPAVFVQKAVQSDTEFPPYRASMSYYLEEGDPAKFDNFTGSQIESYPAIKDWFRREQWKKAEIQEGSLRNFFTLTDGSMVQRDLRYFEDEFNKLLVLRISRIEAGLGTVGRYCYFDKHLGEITPPFPTEGQEIVFGNSGPVEGQRFYMINPRPQELLSSIQLTNGDRDVEIDFARINLVGVGPSGSPKTFLLLANQTVRFLVTGVETFKADGIEFHALGYTSNIKASGITASQPVNSGPVPMTIVIP